MKLICSRPMLANAFHTVSAVVPTRTPKDILKEIKLEVADGRATLIGTDQEIGIRYELGEVQVDGEGDALLPNAQMSSILREVQEESIELEIVDDVLWVRSGHSEFRLSGKDPAEFPPVAGFEEDRYFVVAAAALKKLIRRTVYATDVESTRYALGGVLAEVTPERITLAATDSRRLAVATTACRAEGVETVANEQPVVPSKAMSLIERSLSDAEDEVQLAVRSNDVVVKCGPTTIYSRLVEGRFPRYRDVIPNESRYSIELAAGPFYSAVRQAQIVVNDESRGVDFTFANGLLVLKSVGLDVGESKVEIPIAFEGEELTITFDPRFVAEFFRILETGTSVRLELIDHEKAAVFRTDDDYVYVIMPLTREK